MDTIPAAQAVESLIREYYKLVFHTIYGLTGNWEESQDLTQDTFHQALKAIDAARAASGAQFHAKAWLLRIALNTVRMQRRRRTIFRFIPFSGVQTGEYQGMEDSDCEALNEQALPVQPAGYGAADPGDPAELIAEQDTVRRAMAKLPEGLRICLLLSIIGGLAPMEIAALLDLNEAAVRQRLARARKQFKQIYAHESCEELFEPVASEHINSTTRHSKKDHVAQQALTSKPQRLLPATQPSSTGRKYV